jgi:hypothetical protein
MKTPSCNIVLKCFALALVMCLCASARAGEKPAVSATAQPEVPKAAFVDTADNGKDPFFPTSMRRFENLTRTTVTNTVAPSNALFRNLALKGISGTRSQPFALINGATVTVGELAEIKCGNQVVKVRCREIRDRSVLLELDGIGETRELKLREGI